MAVIQQQSTEQEQGFGYHFFHSTYITVFTEWLLGFGGKSAHVILIFTMIYMSAELYPGVTLPAPLNMFVFLLQMFALDMGGMGLASLARQARADGNTEGADKAQKLSNWLIGIMIAGLVTVCLEQAVSHIPGTGTIQGYIDAAKMVIEVGLVIARAFCAVLYGVVIHRLKTEARRTAPAPTTAPAIDYQELARQVAAILPAPAIDHQEIVAAILPAIQTATTGHATGQHHQPETPANQSGQPANTGHTRKAAKATGQHQPATDNQTAPSTDQNERIIQFPAGGQAANNSSRSQYDYAAIRAYAAAHPDMTRAAISKTLGVPERTLRRILTGQPATGQDDQAATGQ